MIITGTIMLFLNFFIDNATLYWSGIAMVLIGILGAIYTDEKSADIIKDLLDMFWIFD